MRNDNSQTENCSKIEKLLTVACGANWTEPLTVEELLEIGREAIEPLFHESALGPIPDYLQPHSMVPGCIAEYEEKLEELHRWKVQRLTLRLQDKVGDRWMAGGKVYELYMKKGEASATDRYWVRLSAEKD